ncbi:MAG: glycosyltransferase family 2 protein [Chloroflexi bacterium]|nr:MAG: glycosyltransferase family 2 protein [Chloroflexota bacterium]
MSDLGVVIVNYNTRDLLRDCLASLFASEGDFAFEVCVVDNASQDGSAEMVAQTFPQVRLIRSPVNGGYAYANNLGLRALGFRAPDEPPAPTSPPTFALLLNPDTVVPPRALQGLLDFMARHPEAGIVGPKLLRMDGSLDLACRRSFPTPEVSFWRMTGLSKLFPRSRRFGRYNLTYLDPDETAEVDAVVGACMLVRGEAIRQVGLLDEAFFMYGEDLDWAKRIKEAGWKVYYYPEVIVHHVKRASSRRSARAQIEFNRAMRIFYEKHYAATTPRWLHLLVLTGIGLRDGWVRLRLALRRPLRGGGR